MIYPTLHIANNNLSIHLIDTEYDDNPVLQFGNFDDDPKQTFEFFYTLLTLFINQYNDGLETGLMLSEEDGIDYDEQEKPMQEEYLIIEPIGKQYRIVTADADKAIILSTMKNVPIEVMEEIKENLNKHIKKFCCSAYADGYEEGWNDSAKDEFEK